jgi:hypothetical protein
VALSSPACRCTIVEARPIAVKSLLRLPLALLAEDSMEGRWRITTESQDRPLVPIVAVVGAIGRRSGIGNEKSPGVDRP